MHGQTFGKRQHRVSKIIKALLGMSLSMNHLLVIFTGLSNSCFRNFALVLHMCRPLGFAVYGTNYILYGRSFNIDIFNSLQ